ncbi:D-2-hydroxyacid dehydrogenase [Pantoea sp. Bo_2]|uniref:D-2-hydroxyacid dehydrogenase n=1 Tax=unclassified Pantoea TaxID=2630326 RepID=UPI001231F9BE|nr:MULTISPECIES: D-2-hydroxyacid dehydrogenase [unclassified Pantoea]KAA5938863.1 D-2-hydroxyacid dehydrogenase [Pantoea sp. VH_3]KAA5948077.1 D-2-hydroxyacid dehydrogenase [Pantoea sp. VH_25]KAA5957155.1 D-2-hydroxyacid dehydrogenase [Pantoea sp. VH_16]KAA5958031.1 D-2-hydroxyacid dehydrogenase [Pantoea sp. VH_24]KAA5962442.1 D-2-hydroxyacid dehydrogenase [Pantoea sp. VH_18]
MKIVMLDGDTLPVSLPTRQQQADWEIRTQTPVSDIVSSLTGATVAITNKVPLRADTLAQLPELRFICVAATGYDCVDLNACRERGIVVSNVPGYSTQSVSEAVIAAIFALRRQIMAYAVNTRIDWPQAQHFCLHRQPIGDIGGATLGIAGRGNIGQAVGSLAQALGMKVQYAERKGSDSVREGYVSFEQMLATSDIISLHCPLSDSTRQMIDRDALEKMKPHALLINTARGGLINEADLAEVLKQGLIGGAALDVLSSEPPSADNPLLADLPNLLLTPHIAWASRSGVENLVSGVMANIAAFIQGEPINVVS